MKTHELRINNELENEGVCIGIRTSELMTATMGRYPSVTMYFKDLDALKEFAAEITKLAEKTK